MKIETLKERIEKKEAQIEKKANTINKKYDLIAKKQAKAETADEQDRRWLEGEIETLTDDIKRLGNEIKEAQATLEKYKKQLEGEIEKEQQFIKEVPQQAKDMEQMLIARWDEADKIRQTNLMEEEKEIGYRAFVQKHSYAEYEFLMKTDDEIHKSNVKSARAFVLDLLNRTKEITGEIVSWSDVHLTVGTNGYPVLNGYVEGKEGRAVVESIYAGGYNIQRLHVRVLVKAC